MIGPPLVRHIEELTNVLNVEEKLSGVTKIHSFTSKAFIMIVDGNIRTKHCSYLRK